MTFSDADLFRALTQLLMERVPDFSEAPAHTFSAPFEAKMRRLIDRERRRPWAMSHPRVIKILIAAAIMALLLASSALAAQRYGFQLINFGTDGILKIQKHNDLSALDLKCGYIPEGYVLIDSSHNPGYAYYGYSDMDDGFFNIQKMSSYDTVSFDTDGRKVIEKEKNGITYTVLISPENATVVWINPETGILYTINGNVDDTIIFEIALHCE